MNLEHISEKIRFDAASAVFHRAWRCHQKGVAAAKGPRPKGWIASPFDSRCWINPGKLRSAVDYFDISLAIYPDLTAMNLRALTLKLLGDWDRAIAAFEAVAAAAQAQDDKPYVDVAEAALVLCRRATANRPTETTVGDSEQLEKTEPEKFAESFADAVTQGRYGDARGMLAGELKKKWSEKRLKSTFLRMIGDTEGAVQSIDMVETLEEWPGKRTGDVGWLYVSLTGEDFSEAITVVVARDAGVLQIRELEWGRP